MAPNWLITGPGNLTAKCKVLVFYHGGNDTASETFEKTLSQQCARISLMTSFVNFTLHAQILSTHCRKNLWCHLSSHGNQTNGCMIYSKNHSEWAEVIAGTVCLSILIFNFCFHEKVESKISWRSSEYFAWSTRRNVKRRSYKYSPMKIFDLAALVNR